MTDFRVTFVGNLGNLAQFNSAIRGAFASNASALQRANSGVVSRALGRPVQGSNIPLSQTRSPGLYLQNSTVQFDKLNNSITQTTQVAERFITGYTRGLNAIGKVEVKPIFGEAYQADIKRTTNNLKEYEAITGRLAATDAKLLQINRQGQTRLAGLENKINPIQNAYRPIERITDLPNAGFSKLGTTKSDAQFRQLFASLTGINAIGRIPDYVKHPDPAIGITTKGFLDPATATWRDLQRTITNSGGQIKTIFTQIVKQLEKEEAALGAQITQTIAKTASAAKAVQNTPLVRSLRNYQDALLAGPEGLDAQSSNVLKQYPSIRTDLAKKASLGAGTPYGTPQFYAAANAQEFKVTDVSKNVSSGLSTVTGQLRDSNGVLNTFTYSIDKNNKVVDSWGRKLYSAGGFLNETASRLIRFTEFMVGATVVLGAFSIALSSVSKINELNASLQRFAITARLNDTELGTMFKKFSEVAKDTATPLLELITSADDIALATRKANQTTEEWHQSMVQLAYAVGIFTNITGESTTKATEQLVAIMKQLGIETSAVIPLLNQITAAAGGQAGSITDIAQSLASLSEAASEAGLTVTQQIAATQVISLATGKTAEQTAAAFKSLFGAVGSDAAVNKLKEFGISVREANGDLRPFLEIYSDVSEAVNKGIIPEKRVNEVLRALGGGPRRSPDAAALLSNINKVFEVEKIAAGATNEALIANAQILTTNKAKITQFQTAWDTSLYEKLNKTLEDLTTTLAEFGTIFAKIFGAIPQGFISFITQLVAFYTAFSLLGKIAGSLGIGNLFKSISNGFKGVETSAKASAVAIEAANAAMALSGQKQPIYFDKVGRAHYRPVNEDGLRTGGYVPKSVSGPYLKQLAAEQSLQTNNPVLLNNQGQFRYANGGKLLTAAESEALVKNTKNSITTGFNEGTKTTSSFFSGENFKSSIVNAFGGAAIGAISALSSGGTPARIGSNAAQFGAFGALAAGGPAGIAIGAGLGLLSVILGKTAEEEEKVKTKTQELQLSMYNLTQEWKINQAGVDAASSSYEEIKTSLRDAVEGTTEYKDLQSKLGTASVDLTAATDTQRVALEKMLTVLQQLQDLQGGKDGPNWSGFIKNILAEGLDPKTFKDIQGALSEAIYTASGQGIYSSKIPIGFDSNALNYNAGQNRAGSIGLTEIGKASGLDQKTFTAANLLDESGLVKYIANLAKESFSEPNPYNNANLQFPLDNPEAVAAYRSGLEALLKAGEINQAAVDVFEKAVRDFANAPAVVSQSIRGYTAQTNKDYTLAQITPEEYQTSLLRKNLADILSKELNDSLKSYDPNFIGPQTTKSPQSITSNINSLLTNPDGSANVSSVPLDQLRAIIIEQLKESKNWVDIKDNATAVNSAIAEQLVKWGASKTVIDSVTGAVQDLGATASTELAAMSAATDEWGRSLQQGVGQHLLDLQARLQGGEFKGKQGGIQYNFLRGQFLAEAAAINTVVAASHNLENALGQGAAGAAGFLLNQLNALNINGFQGVEANLGSLNTAFFGWITTLNLSGTQITKAVGIWIQVMTLAARAARFTGEAIRQSLLGTPTAASDGLGTPHGGTANLRLSSTGTSGISIEKQIAALLGQLNTIGKSGGGSYTPGTGPTTSKSTGTVGTIYLNEEQQKLSDPLALVKQAYQDALKIQAQIPGETKKNRNSTVAVFDDLQKIFQVKGISEELLRNALDKLTQEMVKANQKADTVRRIRVGSGDFSAIANVPVNSQTGVSVGGSNQINITFNLNGITTLTPANIELLKNAIGAEIARRL